MNFAKKELMKYGWKEGRGLGKEGSGILQPIRQKLKFDFKGFGYDYGEEFSYKWWEHVYDQAASNISVESAKVSTRKVMEAKDKFGRPKNNYILKEKNIKKKKKENPVSFDQKEDLDRGSPNNYCNHKSHGSLECKKQKREFSGKLARLRQQEQQFINNKQLPIV